MSENLSRFLSLVLRHKPELVGLVLEEGGWVPVTELLARLSTHRKHPVGFAELVETVRTNDKKRFAFSSQVEGEIPFEADSAWVNNRYPGLKIRASQGHSVEVDLNLKPSRPPDILFHGTATRTVKAIMQDGIRKMSRQHVHLSVDVATARKVGGRHGTASVLGVNAKEMAAQGHQFYLSDNKVWLTDVVPARYVSIYLTDEHP